MGTVYLIEYQNHYEVLRSLGEFFLDLRFQVVIITNENCRNNLSDLLNENGLSVLDVYTSPPIAFNPENDISIYITPYNNGPHNELPIKAEHSHLLIHNLNYWLNPYQNIYLLKHPFTKAGLNILKYWKLNSKRKNDEFLSMFKGLLAPSELRFDQSFNSKLKGTLNLSYCRPNPINLKDDKVIRVVTPGTVNKDRNYLVVIEALAKAATKHHQKIKYTLLGKNNSLNSGSIKEYKNFEIEVFEKEVSHDRFNSEMNNAHFCIVPLKKDKNYKGINEVRGKTCITGSFNDVLRSNTPAILPEFYPIPETLSSLFYSYHNQSQLESVIDRLISENTFYEIKQESFNEVKKYMDRILEKQKDMLPSLLNE